MSKEISYGFEKNVGDYMMTIYMVTEFKFQIALTLPSSATPSQIKPDSSQNSP